MSQPFHNRGLYAVGIFLHSLVNLWCIGLICLMAVASAQEGDVIDVTEGIEGTAPNHGLHAPSFKIHFGLFQNWNTQSTMVLECYD